MVHLLGYSFFRWRHDTQLNDTQHNSTLHSNYKLMKTFSIGITALNPMKAATEWCYDECCISYCYAECHSVECRWAECRGVLQMHLYYIQQL